MEKRDVWNVLVEEAGADESRWEEFDRTWPECVEFRFGGLLGAGGKIWAGSVLHVTYYREDATPERDSIIEQTNARLAGMAPKRSEST